MKLGIIIPTRPGDRPLFLANCLRQIETQTLKPTEVFVVDEPPKDHQKDITYRYRKGYDYFRNKGFDLIVLIEDDEFYSPIYLETMVSEWVKAGKPDLFGTNYTIYYHIRYFAKFTMHHERRSSAMSTLIKPDLNFPWCPDNEAFTDVWLYKTLKYKLFTPKEIICIGIKHGVGLTGGNSHMCDKRRYVNGEDINKEWLKANTTKESFEFFAGYFNQ